MVRFPKMWSWAPTISSLENPRKPSVSKNGSSNCSSLIPRLPVHTSLPSREGAKAERRSKTSARLPSTAARSDLLKPASIRRSRVIFGQPVSRPVPRMYSSMALHSLSE